MPDIAPLAPQPDFNLLSVSLQHVAEQVKFMVNIPAPTTELGEVMGLLRNINEELQDIKTQLRTLNEKYVLYYMCIYCSLNSHSKHELLPMKLANASARRSAPLRGPNGMLTAPAPKTQEELITVTGRTHLILS
jgi:hypothetical protein